MIEENGSNVRRQFLEDYPQVLDLTPGYRSTEHIREQLSGFRRILHDTLEKFHLGSHHYVLELPKEFVEQADRATLEALLLARKQEKGEEKGYVYRLNPKRSEYELHPNIWGDDDINNIPENRPSYEVPTKKIYLDKFLHRKRFIKHPPQSEEWKLIYDPQGIPNPPERLHRVPLENARRIAQQYLHSSQRADYSGPSPRFYIEPIASQELTDYRTALQEKNAVIDTRERFARCIENVKLALLERYGQEIGEGRINGFFDSFSLDHIFAIPENRYNEVVSHWGETPRRDQQGFYDKYSKLIFVKYPNKVRENENPRMLELYLMEELLHAFLDSQSEHKPIRDLINKLNSIRYSWDAEEQIVHAMDKALTPIICVQYGVENLTDLDPKFRRSAQKGRLRISELGWPTILRGKYTMI